MGPQGAAFCGNSALRSWGLDQCMQWDARMPLVDGGRRYDSDGFRLAGWGHNGNWFSCVEGVLPNPVFSLRYRMGNCLAHDGIGHSRCLHTFLRGIAVLFDVHGSFARSFFRFSPA